MRGVDYRLVNDRHIFKTVRKWRDIVEIVICFFVDDVSNSDDSPFAWEDDVPIRIRWVRDIEYLQIIYVRFLNYIILEKLFSYINKKNDLFGLLRQDERIVLEAFTSEIY